MSKEITQKINLNETIKEPHEILLSIPLFSKRAKSTKNQYSMDAFDIREPIGTAFIPYVNKLIYQGIRGLNEIDSINSKNITFNMLIVDKRYWVAIKQDNKTEHTLSNLFSKGFSITESDHLSNIESYIVSLTSYKVIFTEIENINSMNLTFEFYFVDKEGNEVYCISNTISYKDLVFLL